jgi:hypothetical protein
VGRRALGIQQRLKLNMSIYWNWGIPISTNFTNKCARALEKNSTTPYKHMDNYSRGFNKPLRFTLVHNSRLHLLRKNKCKQRSSAVPIRDAGIQPQGGTLSLHILFFGQWPLLPFFVLFGLSVAAAALNKKIMDSYWSRTHAACRRGLLALLSSLLFARTAGLGGFLTCESLTAEAVKMLKNSRCGSAAPSCSCQTAESGVYYARCEDAQRMCSSLNSSMCGTQTALFHDDDVGDGSKLYYFTYDSGVQVYYKSYLVDSASHACAASITDADGTEWHCSCKAERCGEYLSYILEYLPLVDCNDYQAGAVANACLEEQGYGVNEGSGVMLAYSIYSGFCVAAPAAPEPEPAPVPVPVPVAAPTPAPVAAPVPVPVAAPAPPPSNGNSIASCEDFTAEAAKMLNGECGPSAPSCKCETTEEGTYFGMCQDPQQICSTLDSSFCGIRTSAYSLTDSGNDFRIYIFHQDNGVQVSLMKYKNSITQEDVCDASITDEAGTEKTCGCRLEDCPDGVSRMPFITCRGDDPEWFADGCISEEGWGVQRGIMLAYPIKSGFCVAESGESAPAPVPLTSGGEVLSKSIAVVAVSLAVGVVVFL